MFTAMYTLSPFASQGLVAADPRMHYVECGQEFIKEQMLGLGLDPVRSLSLNIAYL